MSQAKYDFVIVGAGILGTALAMLASRMGYAVLVLRLSDKDRPSADTLRNQGWLQSGVMYRLKEFQNPSAYKVFANKTYFAGLEMLEACDLPVSTQAGILSARERDMEELLTKVHLLNMPADQFRRLESDEIATRLGEFAEPGAHYFAIPDTPFDEAGVLRRLRDEAVKAGAEFVEVSGPVAAVRTEGVARLRVGDCEIQTPLVVVTAGAGSFGLMEGAGMKLDGSLRKTPLLVGAAPTGMPAPIMVDLGRGFSAVRHDCEGMADGAVVMGTRTRMNDAPFVEACLRTVLPAEARSFMEGLPPKFQDLPGNRFTAGYEVIPGESTALNAYQPWIQVEDNIVFASPGRATVSLMAAQQVMAHVVSAVRPESRGVVGNVPPGHGPWSCDIAMHYTRNYSFNDFNAANV